jgi:MinD-like ATPase involved in chromosome partitioning or flagellar assembly
VLSSSGGDVRALFDKAKMGAARYKTFDTNTTPAKNDRTADVQPKKHAMPAPANESMPRRALSAILEANGRPRITASWAEQKAFPRTPLMFASVAGGVGKTTLSATLGRIFSTRTDDVLIADRCHGGIIPYYFASERQRPGGLQVIQPTTRRPGYPMSIVNAPCEASANVSADWLEQLRREATWTVMDLPTFPTCSSLIEAVRVGQPVIPLTPDVQSIASLTGCEELFAQSEQQEKKQRCLFVLNRFDETRALHREIRSDLEKLFEGRMAPVALRESESVAEALSLGMTIVDHVPQSPITRDFEQFAQWLQEQLLNTSSEKIEIA